MQYKIDMCFISIHLNLQLFLQMFIQRAHSSRNLGRMGGTILKRHNVPIIPKIRASYESNCSIIV